MKSTLLLLLTLSSASVFSQASIAIKDSTKAMKVVDVACGTCKLGLAGSDCILAARIGKIAYFVEGTSIDDHGDAHGSEGFCKSIRSAEVQGEVVDDKFKVSYFKLLPKK